MQDSTVIDIIPLAGVVFFLLVYSLMLLCTSRVDRVVMPRGSKALTLCSLFMTSLLSACFIFFLYLAEGPAEDRAVNEIYSDYLIATGTVIIVLILVHVVVTGKALRNMGRQVEEGPVQTGR